VTRSGRTIGMLSTYWPSDRRLAERELRFLDLLARQAAETIERRRTDDALRDSERRLSAELADTRLLQALSAQLITEQNSMTLYETIVDAATSIMHSEYASLQMLHPERGNGGELRLIASRGFSEEAKQLWQWVTRDTSTTCGAALRFGVRVTAPDIAACEFMAGTQDQGWLLQSGIHASQTTPLVSRGGRMLGMLSTHWRQPHQTSERDLRLLDLLARQAADLMERTQAEEALRMARALGAARGVLVAEPKLQNADAKTLTEVLRAAISGEAADLVLLGDEVLDGDYAQVAPRVAEALGWPFVESAMQIERTDDGGLKAIVRRREGYRALWVKLPAVVSVARDSNRVRYAPAPNVIYYFRQADAVDRLPLESLGLELGSAPPCSVVTGEGYPLERKFGEVLDGSLPDTMNALEAALRTARDSL
jgi:electron transfer flavoprotein alpha/beta subunit